MYQPFKLMNDNETIGVTNLDSTLSLKTKNPIEKSKNIFKIQCRRNKIYKNDVHIIISSY